MYFFYKKNDYKANNNYIIVIEMGLVSIILNLILLTEMVGCERVAHEEMDMATSTGESVGVCVNLLSQERK